MTIEIIEREKQQIESDEHRNAGVVDAVRIAGERTGLYEIIAGAEVDEEELAVRAGLAVGAARGWLETQYRAGFMDRDAITRRYRLWCPTPGF